MTLCLDSQSLPGAHAPGTRRKRARDTLGHGGRAMSDPPVPKRQRLIVQKCLDSAYVQSALPPVCVAAKERPVFVLPTINVVSAKEMCLPFTPTNAFPSKSALCVLKDATTASTLNGPGALIASQGLSTHIHRVEPFLPITNDKLFNNPLYEERSNFAPVLRTALHQSPLITTARSFPTFADRGRQGRPRSMNTLKMASPQVSLSGNSRLSTLRGPTSETSNLTTVTRASDQLFHNMSGSSANATTDHMTATSHSRRNATRVIHKNPHDVVVPLPGRVTIHSRVTSPPPFLSNPLRCRLQNWRACAPSSWVLRTITQGYRLQFSRRPPLTTVVKVTTARGESLVTLREEIGTLLHKGAIQQVDLTSSPSGFYSKYFLVEKKGGGRRPILDLRGLNASLKKLPFKMLTTSSLLKKVRPGTWFTSVDLKDAFFHVSIYPPHRKFLRFGFEGRVFQYTVLPFGMSLSPRVFSKCTQAAIAPLRAQGVRLDIYLDDCLISADTRELAIQHTQLVVSHLNSLGFHLNMEKSSLVPFQRATFLGIMLDSTTLRARLSQERIDNFLTCARSLHPGNLVSYKTCMRLAGFMASSIHLIRLGRFYMRPFLRWMLALKVPSSQGHRQVLVTESCTRALRPWLKAGVLASGVSMGPVPFVRTITTDASMSGWGAILDGQTAKGVWGRDLRSYHINFLELMAVYLALQRFERLVLGCHVRIRTDNTTTMCYINKQGGLRSPVLDDLARKLTLWCDSRLASISAMHVPGLQNLGADLLSRGRFHYGDWTLHPGVVSQIFSRYGRAEVDLFATAENATCALFFALEESAPLGADALAHEWPRKLLYAFPPLQLISSALERIRLRAHSVLLVAPGWGTWRSEIASLLYDQPWRLPPLRDLVSQAGRSILHPRPVELDLWVWPVGTRPSLLPD